MVLADLLRFKIKLLDSVRVRALVLVTVVVLVALPELVLRIVPIFLYHRIKVTVHLVMRSLPKHHATTARVVTVLESALLGALA